MNKIQGIIALTMLIATIIASQYFLYFVTLDDHEHRCGIVQDKIQPTTMDIHKHSADININEYLYVNYNGYVKKHEVDANTYYKYNKGDRICFNERILKSPIIVLINIIFSTIGIIVDICFIIAIIRFIWFIIGGSSIIDALEEIIDL